MSLREEQALIADWIRDGSRVLDLGCGDGTLLAHLQTGRGVTGYGIEIDPENILRCLERGVNVIQSDLNRGLSDFDNDSFDYVVMTQTLQAMREVYGAHGYALDPHSAVGVYALDHVHAVKAVCRSNPTICVLTAHPAKFGEACAQAGLPPSVCDDPRVDVLKTKPHHFTCLRDPGAGSRADKLQAWAREIMRAVEGQDELAQTSVLAATTCHSRSKL